MWRCFFREIEQKGNLKKINKLNNNKACQQSEIPTKSIKGNSNIFSEFLY